MILHWLSRSRPAVAPVPKGPRLGVRGLVVDPQHRILLVRRAHVPGWRLPGGHVEAGERALTALARKLENSDNIFVSGEPLLHGLFFDELTQGHIACYVVTEFRQGTPREGTSAVAEAEFFTLDSLPTALSRAARARVDEIMLGAPVSQTW